MGIARVLRENGDEFAGSGFNRAKGSKMTQKDYIKIAKVLRESLRQMYHGDLLLPTIERFVSMLEVDNPRFNRETFHKAIFK